MKYAHDPYETLQVIPSAQQEVIQAAFRTLARLNHPDLGGSEEAMAMLNEAWGILKDRRRRARYDRQRATAAVVEAAKAEAAAPAPSAPTQARPATPTSSGSVLDFGRYQGRTLAELSVYDPEYLEWLVRTRIGNRFRREVDSLLETSRLATAGFATASAPAPRRGLFHRR